MAKAAKRTATTKAAAPASRNKKAPGTKAAAVKAPSKKAAAIPVRRAANETPAKAATASTKYDQPGAPWWKRVAPRSTH